MSAPQKSPRWSEKLHRPVKAGIATLAILAGAVGPGLLGVKWSDPDQGKRMTIAEFKAARHQAALRMQDDPAIPAQAKAMALSALEQFGGEKR